MVWERGWGTLFLIQTCKQSFCFKFASPPFIDIPSSADSSVTWTLCSVSWVSRLPPSWNYHMFICFSVSQILLIPPVLFSIFMRVNSLMMITAKTKDDLLGFQEGANATVYTQHSVFSWKSTWGEFSFVFISVHLNSFLWPGFPIKQWIIKTTVRF